MAMAFVEAHSFLKKSLAEDQTKWIWRNVHSNVYSNTPWSKTPLKFLFHREVPTPGNFNTPNVAKTSTIRAFQEERFTSHHTANLKLLFQLAKDPADEVNQISIDTANGGNLF